jgi:hypothetical protein
MLDKVTIRSARLEELAARPELARESAVVIVGTGFVAVPISLIQKFAEMPSAPAELEEFAEALQAAAVEAAATAAKQR